MPTREREIARESVDFRSAWIVEYYEARERGISLIRKN